MSELLDIVRDTLSMVEQGVISPEEAEFVIRAHAIDTSLPGTLDSDFDLTARWITLREVIEKKREQWNEFESKFLDNLWPTGVVPNVEEVRRARAFRSIAVHSIRQLLRYGNLLEMPSWLRGAAQRIASERV